MEMEQKSDFKRKRDEIFKVFDEKLKKLNYNAEDAGLIYKLTEAYCRKRKGVSNSRINTTAAALLWVYSKVNFLWEGGKDWSRQALADLFEAKAKTVGDKASEIMKALAIDYWDDRFARKDIAEESPYKKYVMAPSGMIVPKDMLPEGIYYPPLKKGKTDYFYDGLDYLDEGDFNKAINSFKKALKIDDKYIDAYNGFGNAYLLLEDYEKSKEFYKKAYLLTKEHFKGIWPSKLPWGILENRQYLRAICGFAICLWKENNIQEAKRFFMLLLKLNPDDNQGIRFVVAAVHKGVTFEEYDKMQEKAMKIGNYEEIDKLLEEQNKIHNFWEYGEK